MAFSYQSLYFLKMHINETLGAMKLDREQFEYGSERKAEAPNAMNYKLLIHFKCVARQTLIIFRNTFGKG